MADDLNSTDTPSATALPRKHSDLAARLHFSPETGHIWLAGRRMLLVHADSMGLMRRELVQSLGMEAARQIYMRQGYDAGTQDAELAAETRPEASLYDMFAVGPQMHALEGIVLAETVTFDVDIEAGRFRSEYRWRNSSECAAHLSLFGSGHIPAGWSQCGYASGFASKFLGRPILYREVACIAKGDPECRILGRPKEEWDEDTHDGASEPGTPILPLDASSNIEVREGSNHPASRLLGASAGFNLALDMARRVADTQASVILLGESGVGKEMFARAIHRLSPRKDKPFVAINCAAMPETLFEAELFGVERGAFTGADASRPGKFELADGGTIFLDEIGTLPLAAQAKLLRVLQEQEVERLGSAKARAVDTRVVAATNVDLRQAVNDGSFRDDLWFRLNVFPITIPPLRERRADIPVLIAHYLKLFSERHTRNIPGLSEAAISALLNYDWPGNVRELANVIERGVILSRPGETLSLHHLFTAGEQLTERGYGVTADGLVQPEATREEAEPVQKLLESGMSLEEIEERLLAAALNAHDGNRSRAAKALGVSRARYNYRLRRHGLEG